MQLSCCILALKCKIYLTDDLVSLTHHDIRLVGWLKRVIPQSEGVLEGI